MRDAVTFFFHFFSFPILSDDSDGAEHIKIWGIYPIVS